MQKMPAWAPPGKRLHRPFGLLAALLLLLLETDAQATMVLPVTWEEMAHRANVVVHARVREQRVVWEDQWLKAGGVFAATRGRILTLTRLDVIDPLKGVGAEEPLVVYQVGGSIDGVTYAIPGALRFRPGEEIIFFAMRLKGPPAHMLVSYGMGLGKYVVVAKAAGDGARRVVVPEYGDVTFVQPAAGQGDDGNDGEDAEDGDRNARLRVVAPPSMQPVPVATFIDNVRTVIAQDAAGRGGR